MRLRKPFLARGATCWVSARLALLFRLAIDRAGQNYQEQASPNVVSRKWRNPFANGSIDLYLRFKAPAGKESNWLASPGEKGYFATGHW